MIIHLSTRTLFINTLDHVVNGNTRILIFFWVILKKKLHQCFIRHACCLLSHKLLKHCWCLHGVTKGQNEYSQHVSRLKLILTLMQLFLFATNLLNDHPHQIKKKKALLAHPTASPRTILLRNTIARCPLRVPPNRRAVARPTKQ